MLDPPVDRRQRHDAGPVNYEIEIEIRNLDLHYGLSKALMMGPGIRAAFEASASRR